MASCKPTPSTFPPTDSHWLSPHRSGFLESLAAQGYAERTVKSFRRMVDRLCAEAEARGLGPDTLDADVVGELAGACPRTGTSHMERELAMATRRFTDRLVRAGAIAAAPPTQPPPGSPEQLCAELDHWLRDHLGMFGNRLRAHRKVLRRVIEFCCTATGTAEDLAAVTPEAVFAFLDGCAGRAGWRLPHVRTILRFPFWSGRIPRDLSDAVAGPAGGHPTACPAISKPASSGSCSKPSAATARSICATTRCSCRWRAWVCGRRKWSGYGSTTSTGARAVCSFAARAGSSTACRSPRMSAKPSSPGCAAGARGTRAICSCAYARRTHRSHRPGPSAARFAKRTGGPVSSRPEARRGPMRCGTASPWRCWTGGPRSGRSAMSSATAPPGRRRRMQGTTTGRCVRWPARGRCREGADDPGRRTRGTVPRPAGGLRDRPVGQRGSGTEEVRRLRGGRGGRACDHGAVPALEGPAARRGEPANLVLSAQPCAHLRPLAAEPGAGNGGAAAGPDPGKPETAAAVHPHGRRGGRHRRRGGAAAVEPRPARSRVRDPVRPAGGHRTSDRRGPGARRRGRGHQRSRAACPTCQEQREPDGSDHPVHRRTPGVLPVAAGSDPARTRHPGVLPGRAWAANQEGFGGTRLRPRRPGDRPAGAAAVRPSRHGSPPARPAPHHGGPHARRLVPVRPRSGPRDVQAEHMARTRQSRRDVLVPRGGPRATPSGHRAGRARDRDREAS